MIIFDHFKPFNHNYDQYMSIIDQFLPIIIVFGAKDLQIKWKIMTELAY